MTFAAYTTLSATGTWIRASQHGRPRSGFAPFDRASLAWIRGGQLPDIQVAGPASRWENEAAPDSAVRAHASRWENGAAHNETSDLSSNGAYVALPLQGPSSWTTAPTTSIWTAPVLRPFRQRRLRGYDELPLLLTPGWRGLPRRRLHGRVPRRPRTRLRRPSSTTVSRTGPCAASSRRSTRFLTPPLGEHDGYTGEHAGVGASRNRTDRRRPRRARPRLAWTLS